MYHTSAKLVGLSLLSWFAPVAVIAAPDTSSGSTPSSEIAAKPAPQSAAVTAPPAPEDMIALFNGKDLNGWEGNPALWSVKDGVIRGETTAENPTKGNTFLISKADEVEDFELRLAFRIVQGNSGVQYRSKQVESKDNDWVVGGYQAEIANEPGRAGFLYHERGRGRLNLVGEKVVMDAEGKKQIVGSVGETEAIAKTYKLNDWNDLIIIARGNHIEHYLNGVKTIDLTDNDPKGRLMSGIIALQIHAGPPMWVEFRDIYLKRYEKAE